MTGICKLSDSGFVLCQWLFGWSWGSSSAMTPLLPGIVFQPLRFYEAAVTGRANSKRPESTKERWQAAGAWSCNTAMPPPLLCSADQLRHSTPHGFPACISLPKDTQRLWSRTGAERKREQEAERAEMQMQSAPSAKCPFHLKPPFAECKAAPSRLKPNQLLFRKRTWLPAADHSLSLLVCALSLTTDPILSLYCSCYCSSLYILSSQIYLKVEKARLIIVHSLVSPQSASL